MAQQRRHDSLPRGIMFVCITLILLDLTISASECCFGLTDCGVVCVAATPGVQVIHKLRACLKDWCNDHCLGKREGVARTLAECFCE